MMSLEHLLVPESKEAPKTEQKTHLTQIMGLGQGRGAVRRHRREPKERPTAKAGTI